MMWTLGHGEDWKSENFRFSLHQGTMTERFTMNPTGR